MSNPTRRSWDAGRFVQTLNFFEALPVVNWLQKMFFGAPPPPPPHFPAGIILDFRQMSETLGRTWGALDDVVMGGVSASSLQPHSDGALFTGYVSTDNSGGFASVRTRNFEPPMNLAGYTGVELSVKGDGQRYKFFVRDSATWDSMAYAYSFDTVADQWMIVRVPFAEMIPVSRARTVRGAQPLNTARTVSMQLMLSKFEYDGVLNPKFTAGEFRLLVQTIGVY